MFGLGFAANRITRSALEACGVDKKTARRIGRGVGLGTTLLTLDPTGCFDFPDMPDPDLPDDNYGNTR